MFFGPLFGHTHTHAQFQAGIARAGANDPEMPATDQAW